MEREIYKKTEAGQNEIRERKAGLDPRSRQLLILINGERSVGELTTQLGGGDVPERIAAMAGKGLLALVGLTRAAVQRPPGATPPVASSPQAAQSAFRSTLPPPTVESDEVLLQRLRARVLPLLEQQFGPTAHDMAAPLLQATTRTRYIQALKELQDTLAIYRGKKGALELTRPLGEGL